MNDSLLLRLLLDQLADSVFFKDTNGQFVRINKVLASWYGLQDPAQAVGQSEEAYFPKEYARAVREAEQAMLRSRLPILDQEEKVVGRDGKTRWILTTKIPIVDEQGSVSGILGISRDIKGMKHAEEKVRDSAALYQSLIESLPQCIFRKDIEGRYEYVNQRLCDLVGLTPKDYLGKTDFDTNPKALAAKDRRDDKWVMTHEKQFEEVEEFKTKEKIIQIRVVKTPVYDSRGRVVGVQGVFSQVPKAVPKKPRRD